ncbi:MAG: hypothetical protein BJ554DRAFT_6939, partial [Olpidium bornovanus]
MCAKVFLICAPILNRESPNRANGATYCGAGKAPKTLFGLLRVQIAASSCPNGRAPHPQCLIHSAGNFLTNVSPDRKAAPKRSGCRDLRPGLPPPPP